MKRRKKTILPQSAVKVLFVGLLSLLFGLFLFKGFSGLSERSGYFTVKAIEYDSALMFINKRDLANLKGKNIFAIDLKKIQRKLAYKYPQVSDLKVERKFPDRIKIVAIKRMPFAQAQIKDMTLTMDEKGLILSTSSRVDKRLTSIDGLRDHAVYRLGNPIRGNRIMVALQLLKAFEGFEGLQSHKVVKIDVANLSDGVKVIFEREKIFHKMKILNFLLTQGRINLKEIKYIDLRHKDPAIGKKFGNKHGQPNPFGH